MAPRSSPTFPARCASTSSASFPATKWSLSFRPTTSQRTASFPANNQAITRIPFPKTESSPKHGRHAAHANPRPMPDENEPTSSKSNLESAKQHAQDAAGAAKSHLKEAVESSREHLKQAAGD